MGFFENKQPIEIEGQVMEEQIKETPKKMIGFAYWEVNEVQHKLKLKTSNIIELENKFKTNLMNLMGSNGNSGMPALSVMLEVVYAAMKEWEHGIKLKDVQNLFDNYIEEGGSQLAFYTEVYMKIFTISGFFSQTLAKDMEASLEEAKEIM